MNAYFAEFVGTLFFIFSIISTYNPLVISTALAIALYFFSSISGGHFNPAVSIVMTLNGKLSKTHLLPYILAQITGGVCALELLKVI